MRERGSRDLSARLPVYLRVLERVGSGTVPFAVQVSTGSGGSTVHPRSIAPAGNHRTFAECISRCTLFFPPLSSATDHRVLCIRRLKDN